ncbi:MAG: hypothetical protein FWE95_06250 [Planctomycetaceae bacterium]|nr:hypothetical protein [Planctomycetaceae bacterium]
MSVPLNYPLIEGFWIRNFKVFRQIAVGSSFQQSVVMDCEGDIMPYELTPFTVFVGDTATGKSTILDAFAFLADCINYGIGPALSHRGGFESVYHFGGEGPLSIGVVYRACGEPQSLTYVLNIDYNQRTHHPFVETEALIYRKHEPGSQPRPVLLFQNGEKQNRLVQPWVGASGSSLDQVKRTDSTHLGLNALAQIEDLPDIPQFKLYLDKFFVSCYASSNAANLSPPRFKFVPGGNLAHDLKRIKEKHPSEFSNILNVIAGRMPGIEKIIYETSESGRSLLTFKLAELEAAVHPAQLGEGSLRLLSLLTLFEDPVPTPLLGIEEPAAFMGASQINAFTKLIMYHIRELGGTQFFITTSNNTLIDQIDPTDVWFLMRGNDGNIQTSRGLDELQFLGINLNLVGPYWYSEYLYREHVPVSTTGMYRRAP